MNNFFLASNRSVNIDGIAVHQIQMKEFDLWLEHAEKIKESICDKDYSNEIIEKLFLENIIECIKLLELSTKLDHETLLDIAGQPKFFELIKAMLIVNDAYFKTDTKKQKKNDNNGEESTWFDSFQFLISVGHNHNDIMNMTYGTFNEYLKSAQKLVKNKMISNLGINRLANHGDNKEVDKFRKNLKED